MIQDIAPLGGRRKAYLLTVACVFCNTTSVPPPQRVGDLSQGRGTTDAANLTFGIDLWVDVRNVPDGVRLALSR